MRANQLVRRDDRGAVLVIVSVFALVAVLFLAFVVDIGNQRQSRRQLTTETDSVALAVAREWAIDGLSSSFDCDETSVDERLGAYNNPVRNASADPICRFDYTNAPFQGTVTVEDRERVDYAFDGVTGIDGSSTGSSTSVAVGTVPGGGLRPVGLCMLDPDIAQWAAAEKDPALKASPTYDPGPFDIFLPRFLNPLCVDGPSPGNWSQLVLPGAGNGASDFRDDVTNGAGEPVTVNESIPNYTGGGGLNSADTEFEALEGTIFNLPLYTYAERGNGSDVTYPVAGFLEVRLVTSTLDGQDLSFEIQPLRLQESGTCCFANEFNTEFAICDVGTAIGAAGSSLTENCREAIPPPVTTSSIPPPPACVGETITEGLTRSLVTANGSDKDKLTQTASFEFAVQDSGDCGDITVDVMGGTGAGKDPAPSSILLEGNTYTVNFDALDKKFTPGAGYIIEVLHNGVSFSPAVTTELQITDP